MQEDPCLRYVLDKELCILLSFVRYSSFIIPTPFTS